MPILFTGFLVPGQETGDYRSKMDGNWNSASTWEIFNGSNWIDATDVPGPDDVVTITSGKIVDSESVAVGSIGRLHIDGTLIINGDLNMTDNGAELMTDAGANVIIFGSANLGNKVTIDLSSYFIVLGDFLRTGSNQQGSISVTDAHVYVFGTISSSWNNFTGCTEGTYDGTTSSVGDDCDAGRFDDFIEHVEPEDLPDGIFNEIAGCTSPVLNTLPDQIGCENYILPVITGTNLSGNEAYYTGSEGTGTLYNAGDEIASSITLYIYDANGYCWDEVSFDINIENNPITGSLTKTPDLPTVCEGTFVSSELTGGSAGNGADKLEFSTDGGNNWNIYQSGNNISTTGVSEVQIRTRRMADYCSPSDYFTVTWNVDPASVGGTATANEPSICENDNTVIQLSDYTGTIQWQQSVDGSTGWSNVIDGSGETTATYTTPDLTTTTFYRAVVTNGSVCSSSNSTVVKVTVNPLPEIGNFN